MLAAGEAAAEARDVRALVALMSSRFEDAEGGSAIEMNQRLRGWFLLYPSVHLLTRVEGVEFPYADMARVRLTVGTLARPAGPGDTFRLAADVHDVQLELRLERGEWKVTRAAWQPAGGS